MRNILPEGTRDYTTEDCIKRKEVTNRLLKVFNNWGYDEVATPTIEFYETFNCNEQSLGEEQIYKFFDNNGRILVLRPDMTIPVSRLISTKLKDMEAPMKICYLANVFRMNESLLGRQNEFIDCGVELIGVDDYKSDLEILVTAIESIKFLGFDNFKVEIGNVNILKDAMDIMELNDEQKEKIAKLIDKKSITSLELYLSEINIDNIHKNFLVELPWLFGEKSILIKAKEFVLNENVKGSIAYLEQIYNSLIRLGYERYISIDMAMVPRLNYYTGIIFRGYIEGIGESVLGGGRYDNLTINYGRDLKAIGFSLKVDLLLSLYKSNIDNNLEEVIVDEEDEIVAMRKAVDSIKKGKRIKRVYK